jgi:hypothetical protein
MIPLAQAAQRSKPDKPAMNDDILSPFDPLSGDTKN